ncbi:hypothetical protein [uncultured Dubosiella sp.]|uniref:hypothetical protein n=1 Tax=uncultured Dubosiella sp. TaxID=1937011 RepID=UPI0025B5BDA7|nr:hypothetical protein [uncultured Dubosiella sp.]
MSLHEKREARTDALIQISQMLASGKENFYQFLETEEGKRLYKLAMTEVVAEIEISIAQGEITFDFDEGDYLLNEYNENDRREIGQILTRHLGRALHDIVDVLNKPKIQS